MIDFKKELEQLINKHSVDCKCNTADYILADFIEGCLMSYINAVNSRDIHSGKKNENNTLNKSQNKVVFHNVEYKLIPVFEDWEINLVCRNGMPLCPMGHNGKTIPKGHTIMGVRAGKKYFNLDCWYRDSKMTAFRLSDNRILVSLRDEMGRNSQVDLSELQ